MNRAACPSWPAILNPERGSMPLAAAPRKTERVLFVSLQNANEPMAPMTKAFGAACGPCFTADWRDGDAAAVQDRVEGLAHRLRPTIVFLRLQRDETPLTPQFVERLRAHCDRDVVIVHWNGDQYQPAGSPAAAWMVDLGRVCDATLLVNAAEQETLAKAGVRHPGFLAAGYDPECYQPRADVTPKREVVCLANAHPKIAGYERRRDLIRRFTRWGEQCVVYGRGWSTFEVPARAQVTRVHESAIYSGAAAALSVSMHADLERYTSDRLWRMLGCGSVALVERFAGCEAMGLHEGDNCFIWHGWDELGGLHGLLEDLLRSRFDGCLVDMRRNALELAKLHTWEARAAELLAVVDAVRAARA